MTITFARVNALLLSEDMEGLLTLGCPADEYESEARDITQAISKIEASQRTEPVITAIISLIWAKAFDLTAKDMERRLPSIRNIAQRMLQEL